VENLRRLFFNLEVIRDTFPVLLREGLRNTLILAVGAVAIGLVLGMLLALVGISRRRLVRLPALIYIDIFRGLPAILTIVLIGQGLPLAGFAIFGRNRMAYGIMALGLIATAYIAEIFRAGIQSIDKGQMEAARSVGMGHLQAMRLVIVPQAVRRVLPPLTNEFIAITKDSSLIFVLGTVLGQRELFRIGQNVAQQTGNYSAVVAAGMCYLIITIPLTRLVNYMDRRLREGRQAQAEELPAASGGTVPGGHV
jgi:polar amino acid transport system permease protein